MLRISPLELTYDLPQLLQHLENEYYQHIEASIKSAARRIRQLDDDTLPQLILHYIGDTQRLLTELGAFVNMRRLTMMPYIQELVEKKTDGHDCRNCSTSCTVRHTVQAYEIKNAHKNIREAINQLQSTTIPVKQDILTMTCFQALRREIALIEIRLTALFFLEEFSLLPRLLQVQNNIHAHS